MLKFLVESPYERKLYKIEGDRILIGRSRAAEIPLLDERVRKRHLVIESSDEGYRFRDLSKGATRKNGAPESGGALRVGDRLEMGSTVVTLQAILSRPGDTLSGQVPAAEPTSAVKTPPPRADRGEISLPGARSVRVDPAGDKDLTAAGFRSVLEINKRLLGARDEESLLALILDSAIDLMGAERGFLVLADKSRLTVRAARNLHGEPLSRPELEVSQTIARKAIKEGRTILSSDAGSDERWSGMESIAALDLRSVLSAPLEGEAGALGALYLDSRIEKGLFSSRHVSLLEAFSDQAALAIQSAQLAGSLKQKSEELAKRNEEVRRLNAQLSAELDQTKEDLESRQGELEFRYDYRQIVGRSSALTKVLKTLDKVTELNVPVFIEGESGTGKELVARALHFNGPRRRARFVSENCSAIPETLIEKVLFGHVKGAFTGADSDAPGLFEQADGGTLFLDEVGDMSAEVQKKILRVLQEGEIRRVGGKSMKPVDVRIVCATNRDVDKMKDEGEFREDLYWRLVVVRVRMPPLRLRAEDIPLLVDHFIGEAAEEMGAGRKAVESAALDLLSRYPWPGNVRELGNELRRAMALAGERITVDCLSERIRHSSALSAPDWESGRPLKEIVEDVERAVIRRELERTGGNKTKTAAALGLSRLGLRNKMQRYGVE